MKKLQTLQTSSIYTYEDIQDVATESALMSALYHVYTEIEYNTPVPGTSEYTKHYAINYTAIETDNNVYFLAVSDTGLCASALEATELLSLNLYEGLYKIELHPNTIEVLKLR